MSLIISDPLSGEANINNMLIAQIKYLGVFINAGKQILAMYFCVKISILALLLLFYEDVVDLRRN